MSQPQEKTPRPGAVRHRDPLDKERWIMTNPGDLMFSTATMFAEEYYSSNGWKRIFEEDDEQP